ncbi:hypothetical protein Agub_g5640 [Astrephomene gubernaculifera]|uniref:Uncharacterized protein n=1 Tax=Astrephomene gubernaculifera TaxID=47775 RepID=A0AAD3HKT6_9CHLO|nr:hypothetical protein Agub_g5640 [Astrephomene gubernaculifera]
MDTDSQTRGAFPHRVRLFNYERDLKDLQEICANVYGGSDYLPRIVHRIVADPGQLVLAAESSGDADSTAEAPVSEEAGEHATGEPGSHVEGRQEQDGPGQQPGQEGQQQGRLAPRQAAGRGAAQRIDGVICAERRGATLFLYGLRVREGCRSRGLGHLLMEAACTRGPQQLANTADATPPPPLVPLQTPGPAVPSEHGGSETATADIVAIPTAAANGKDGAHGSSKTVTAACVCGPSAVRHLISCTTSYNPAPQRILGRQLEGPLWQLEIWPAGQSAAAHDAAMAEWSATAAAAAAASASATDVASVGAAVQVAATAAEAAAAGEEEEAKAPRLDPPHLLDWLPGARAVLDSDAAASALLPYWRRTTCASELRTAVSSLLYGNPYGYARTGMRTHCCRTTCVVHANGNGWGPGCQGGGDKTGNNGRSESRESSESNGSSRGRCSSCSCCCCRNHINGCGGGGVDDDPGSAGGGYRCCRGGGNGGGGGMGEGSAEEPLLWLPMPYEVWPLDSAFVLRELEAGNIWLLREGGERGAAAAAGGGDGGGSSSGSNGAVEPPEGRDSGGGGGGGDESEGSSSGGEGEGEGGAVVGIMLLTHFGTFGRVCAGILARHNAAAHAAIAHAGSLHPHFLASILRVPFAVTAATNARAVAAAATVAGVPYPLPALYEATEGFKDFWVYGRSV